MIIVDSRATVVLGPFARGGYNRTGIKAVDHDFNPLGRLTPFGLFLPDAKDLSLWMTTSKVTSDFIVDRLEEWWHRRWENYRTVRTLLLDLDNSPENRARWCRAVEIVLEAAAERAQRLAAAGAASSRPGEPPSQRAA